MNKADKYLYRHDIQGAHRDEQAERDAALGAAVRKEVSRDFPLDGLRWFAERLDLAPVLVALLTTIADALEKESHEQPAEV